MYGQPAAAAGALEKVDCRDPFVPTTKRMGLTSVDF